MTTAPYIQQDKSKLRQTLRKQRAAIPAVQRRRAEWQASKQAQARGWLRRGQKIAAYIPVGAEFSAWPLILQALKNGAHVYLPQTPKRGRRLRFVRFNHSTAWRVGAFGIPEPVHALTCLPRDFNTVFMPLLGFDAQGGRLGQGGGYYDSTFAFRRLRQHWKKPRLVGLAFACQQVQTLPHEAWDVRLDTVLGHSLYDQTNCAALSSSFR